MNCSLASKRLLEQLPKMVDEIRYAASQRYEQERRERQYSRAEESREAAEASGGYCIVCGKAKAKA